MSHRPQYRRLGGRLWSVGCSCGWLCDHPLRGERSRAQVWWRAHRDQVDTLNLGRLMRTAATTTEKDGAA